MSFFADKQTLDDLNIPGRFKANSIAHLFDRTITAGGRKLMDHMFQHPLSDSEQINKRSGIFKYFTTYPVPFPFTTDELAIMENYLGSGGGKNLIVNALSITSKKILQVVAHDKEFELLKTEVVETITLLNRLHTFIFNLPNLKSPYLEQVTLIKKIFDHPKLRWLQDIQKISNLSVSKFISYDYLFRTAMYEEMKSLMELIFQLDVYIAVAGVAAKKGFCYALALPKYYNTFKAVDLYHPAVANAIGNSLSLHQENNVLFLTGANMAGKSTLMKSFGISIYLAHMGFPVAATQLEFAVKDGLYSSINVPDNLDLGYSHFYAEVLRVKTVAEQVAADMNLIVIFDELFKGTNVKDAYDATIAITEAFAENRNCFFVISTHIIEVGEALRRHCDNFRFAYLPTVMQGTEPHYTYQLAEGITTDRHGMMIIENEGILDIIRSGSK